MPQQQTADTSLASDEKLAEWVERFAPYRLQPTKQSLLAWLQQFDREHVGLAHKILDAVVLISELQIHQGYRETLTRLPGWHRSIAKRSGRWFFVGAGSPGESGPAMLRLFREANGLTSNAWQSFFVTIRELPSLGLTALDNVVLVDDFAGTGKQITAYWNDLLQELIASEARCYLLLTATTDEAFRKISNETELELHSSITLPSQANVFSSDSEKFTSEEQLIIERYGAIAWTDYPRGFGECGLTFVLSHKTPNNSLPILHANHRNWTGPFPRSLISA